MVKPSPIFDGFTNEIRDFFDQIKRHKGEVYEDQSNHSLVSNVEELEEATELNYMKYGREFRNFVFFISNQHMPYLENYETNIIYFGGSNPFEIVDNNKYELEINSKSLFTVISLVISIFLV